MLLEDLLKDKFLTAHPPKSTGREVLYISYLHIHYYKVHGKSHKYREESNIPVLIYILSIIREEKFGYHGDSYQSSHHSGLSDLFSQRYGDSYLANILARSTELKVSQEDCITTVTGEQQLPN